MEHVIEEGHILIKRFKVPHKIRMQCPKCNHSIIHDFDGDNYMSYPSLGKNDISIYCHNCGWEKDLEVTLKLIVDYDLSNFKL